MMYIHETSCISPQQTFAAININRLHNVVNNKLQAIEPSYEGIPTGILRRMGKAVRLGVGTALPLLKNNAAVIDGIIIGTANGGMEDCIKFLNQIIDYDEGLLTPTNFVQSTANAVAAQIGLLTASKAYNSTHVHRGLAFENALLDAEMLLHEKPTGNYLVGGVDEISAYNYNIEYLGGWYKKETIVAEDLYSTNTIASIAGEGAAMFFVNTVAANATAKLSGIRMLHTNDEMLVADQLKLFLHKHLPEGEKIDLLLHGENGDSRFLRYVNASETVLNNQAAIARFKHMTGEYPTAAAIALWLACYILKEQSLPSHMLKYSAAPATCNRILIYNHYKGIQHSFILVEQPAL